MKETLIFLIALQLCASYKHYKRETSWEGKHYLRDANKEMNDKDTANDESLVVDLHKCDRHLKNGKDTLLSLACEKDETQRLLLVALAHGEYLSKEIARLDRQHGALLKLLKKEMPIEDELASEKRPAAKEKIVYHYRFGEALPVVTVEK